MRIEILRYRRVVLRASIFLACDQTNHAIPPTHSSCYARLPHNGPFFRTIGCGIASSFADIYIDRRKREKKRREKSSAFRYWREPGERTAKERLRDEMYSNGTRCTSSLAMRKIFKTKGRRRRAGGGIGDRYVSGYNGAGDERGTRRINGRES